MVPDSTPKTRVVHIRDNVPGAVYIGRAMPRQGLKASPFANPYRISATCSRRDAIGLYTEHLISHPELWAQLPELRGKAISCWCRHDGEPITEDNACHGDSLVKLLDYYTDEQLVALSAPCTCPQDRQSAMSTTAPTPAGDAGERFERQKTALAEEAAIGQMTCREVITRSAALGLSTPLMALLLRTCKRRDAKRTQQKGPDDAADA